MSHDPSESKTDSILRAIIRALNKNEMMLNAAVDLRSVRLDVKMNAKTGRPRAVHLLPEVVKEAQPGQDDL